MSGVDLRGFQFALQPLQVRTGWALDAALARAGRLRQELCSLEARLQRLQLEATGAAAGGRARQGLRINTGAHRMALHYLGSIATESRQVEQELGALRAQQGALLEEVAHLQQRLDDLGREHDKAVAVHVRSQSNSHWREADRARAAQPAHRPAEEGEP